jgi:hypothetical protein
MAQSGVLGDRLVGILHSCLPHHSPYNEHTAWATPRASGGSTIYEPGIYRQTATRVSYVTLPSCLGALCVLLVPGREAA